MATIQRSLEDYTIEITNDGKVRPVNRDTGIPDSEYVDLNSENAKIEADETDFYIVGTADDQGLEVVMIDEADNGVTLEDTAVLSIDSNNEIELENYNAFVKLDGANLDFKQQAKE